jgi:hypothetical protein
MKPAGNGQELGTGRHNIAGRYCTFACSKQRGGDLPHGRLAKKQ